MSRNSSILLNRVNKVLKNLDYKNINLIVNFNSVDIIFVGINRIGYSWEPVFKLFSEENITWSIRAENNTIILNILL